MAWAFGTAIDAVYLFDIVIDVNFVCLVCLEGTL